MFASLEEKERGKKIGRMGEEQEKSISLSLFNNEMKKKLWVERENRGLIKIRQNIFLRLIELTNNRGKINLSFLFFPLHM